MNTKTNHEYASNSYKRDIMGNDSPAALLDMLAEVASQTLHSEKRRSKFLLASQCKTKTDCIKKRTNELSFNVPQLLSMPASQLVKQFSIFTSDELKRQYSYTCALIVGCGQKYTSFASEGRARMSIKAHLAEHLEYLKTNKEAYKTFIAKSVSCKNHKPGPQNKRSKLQQSRKPQETLNKENKDIIVEKSTNCLRNTLLNDSTFKELDKNKNVEAVESPKKLFNSEQKDTDRIDFKVLGDHSYFERLKDDGPNTKESSIFNNSVENNTNENIVFMVVGTDSVHMKEYPCVTKKLSEKEYAKSETIYLPELPWSMECNDKNADSATTKPKGKAKFIGTSKEEREMALAFMDCIKKKGNPTGSNLECRICNPPRSFTAPTTLVSHYRSHAGIKPYECRICRAVFTRRHSLKYHMLIHQNQTRFTCADCGKKFRHPSHFREHRRRHTGEAPFGCDDCGQRFKTRNTYKRHLKTRHGKVLTTTGELLHLSEEDFQKVRTNRKKKNDINKDYALSESITATKTIMHHRDDNDQLQNTSDETYIINEDGTGSDKIWESNHAMEAVKNCFETYEVCSESLNKTESVQTEIPIDDKAPGEDTNCLPNEYSNKVQGKSSQLHSNSLKKLEVVHHENHTFVNHNNNGSHEIIYHDINETPSYIQVQYNNVINGVEDENNLKGQENFNLPGHQVKNQIKIIHDVGEDYFNSVSNNFTNEHEIKYIHDLKGPQIQEDMKCRKKYSDINTLDYNLYQEIKTTENAVSEDSIISNISEEVVTTALTTITDTLLNQNQGNIVEEDKKGGNYRTDISNLFKNKVIPSYNYASEKNKKVNQSEQRLYINNEPLTSIVVQNKCINILPHFKLYSDHQNKSQMHSIKKKKFALLNKHIQAINIKQNTNQNTILLLANNALQNNIFENNQYGTDNEIKNEVSTKKK